VLLTFHFVALCWIAFRAPDAATAMRVLTGAVAAPLDGVSAYAGRHIFELLLLVAFFCLHPFDSMARVRLAVRRLRGHPVACAPARMGPGHRHQPGSSAKFVYFDF